MYNFFLTRNVKNFENRSSPVYRHIGYYLRFIIRVVVNKICNVADILIIKKLAYSLQVVFLHQLFKLLFYSWLFKFKTHKRKLAKQSLEINLKIIMKCNAIKQANIILCHKLF